MKNRILFKRVFSMLIMVALLCSMAVAAAADDVVCLGIMGGECPAETHKEGCDKYIAPPPACPGEANKYCAAQQHIEGCDYYIAPMAVCSGTAGVECGAEEHVRGCDKYRAPVCTGSSGEDCAARQHVEGCDKYVKPQPQSKMLLSPRAVDADDVCKIGNQGYKSIQEAVNAAQSGDEIVLIKSVVLDPLSGTLNSDGYYALVNVAGKSITINLNTHTVSADVSNLDVSKYKSATLLAVFASDSNSCVTLKNGTVDLSAGDTFVYSLLMCYEGEMIVESGTYKMDKSSSGRGMLHSEVDDKLTVNGGNFYLGNVGTLGNGSPWIFNGTGQNTCSILVNGGTFNADILHQYFPFEVSAPSNRALKNNGDGTWTMVDAVAFVNEQEWSSAWYTNEVGYATIEEALAAAQKQQVISGKVSAAEFVTVIGNAKLNSDIVNPEFPILIEDGAGIDLNGKNIEGAEITKGAKLNITDSVGGGSAKLKLEDGSEEEYEVSDGYRLSVYSDGKTVLTLIPVPSAPGNGGGENSVVNPYDIPSTGDNSNMPLWCVLFLGFAAVSLFSAKKRRS